MQIKSGAFWLGDCLELMRHIPDGSVDMILCDLPYGTTACKWDTIIPFEPLWEQYWRIAKPNAAIVLTASQPFTGLLVMSQINNFKYEWIWEKSRATGHVHARNKPMKKHENILVFSTGTTVHEAQSINRMNYYPQGLSEIKPKRRKNSTMSDSVMSARPSHKETFQTETNYPHSLLKIASEGRTVHPTQKPVALFEYLIKTYTNPGELVLDNCAGSGTTAIAAERAGRRWLCIEKDPAYYYGAIGRVWNEAVAA